MKLYPLLILFILLQLVQGAFSQEGAIAKIKLVKFGTTEWPPYIGRKLPERGIVTQIVTQAYKRQGYEVKLFYATWARLLREVKQGDLDGILPEYYSQDRLSDFVFTDPFFEGPVGFLTKKDKKISYEYHSDLNLTYDRLKPYKVGVVRDYINQADFDKRNDLAKIIAFSDEDNLKKLHKGEADLIFIDKYVARFLIKKNFPKQRNEFEFLQPPLSNNKLYIAISKHAKDFEQKRLDFNEGLKKITKDSTLKGILKSSEYFK